MHIVQCNYFALRNVNISSSWEAMCVKVQRCVGPYLTVLPPYRFEEGHFKVYCCKEHTARKSILVNHTLYNQSLHPGWAGLGWAGGWGGADFFVWCPLGRQQPAVTPPQPPSPPRPDTARPALGV